MVKFAFDLRGVIVDKDSGEISDEAITSIRLVVEKFGSENVYIISKAKSKWIDINRIRLKNRDFYRLTGAIEKNTYFVDNYEDKEKMCNKLGITYMVDDSIKVMKYLTKTFGWLFTKKDTVLLNNIVIINNWKNLRKRISRLPRE
jgi:hypothetical protein